MVRGITFLLVLVCLAPLTLAMTGPFSYSGKEYYAVTSTDPSEDTGTEVCAKAGLTCVGYTAFSNDVCQMAHPGASVTTSVHGSKAGFYCNGPPQTGLACGSSYDNCQVCPACNVNMDCNTQIGNLFREMYVECAGATQCDPEPTSRTVQDLVAEVPRIHADLQTCPITLPSTFGVLPSNGNVVIDVVKGDGTHEYFTATIANKKVTAFQHGQQTCSQRLVMSEDDANALLGSPDRAGTFKYLYANKRIKVQGCTFLRSFLGFFTQPIGRLIVRQTLPSPPTQWSAQVQQGSLICDFYNGPTKKIVTCAAYKAGDTFCALMMGSPKAVATKCEENGQVICSVPCDTYSAVKQTNRCAFDINRARGTQAPPIGSCPAVQTPPAGKKNPGEVCQHGGECRTGNCVGVGQGPPWVYECSCDPFKFTTGC